jgi:hypothetical protein
MLPIFQGVAVRVSLGSFVVNPMELEAAKEVILKARITDPLSLEGMELLARIHFQLGEVEELRKLVDDAAAASDKRPESTLFLAMISILEEKPVKNTLSLISNVSSTILFNHTILYTLFKKVMILSTITQ